MVYLPRVMDPLLHDLVAGLPAVALEGAKGVGKTESARQLSASVLELDQPAARANVMADPSLVTTMMSPVLIDEWQLVPPVWDVVRRSVDRDRQPGRFILTGSASPARDVRIHSGAGRIVRQVMRPMTLPERGVTDSAVSFAELVSGRRLPIAGQTDFSLADYTAEILASGFPGIRQDPPRLRVRQLNSYLESVVDRDLPELGEAVRKPRALLAWLTAYAAATATTSSYEVILNAATPGDGNKLSKTTVGVYRELLRRMWLLEPLPAWIPALNPLKRLSQTAKHHLVDPALAARLLGATEASLLDGTAGTPIPRQGSLLGALFESLVVLTVRVFAELNGETVSHLRTADGGHEIDLIVERDDHRVLAIEVKLSGATTNHDAKHLNWLAQRIGDQLLDRVIINTGPFAHRLPDGTAVIPLALLGP
jgi:predicted AAA+ superfamily ATPase